MGITGVLQMVRQMIEKRTGRQGTLRTKGHLAAKWDENPGDTTLVAESKMVEILMHAVDSHAEVRVSVGGNPLEYIAHFLPEREFGPGGGGRLSSEYVRDKAYILVGPTEPPEGSEKLSNGRVARFTFVQGGKLNIFWSSLFDEYAVHKSDAPRSPLPASWNLSMTNRRVVPKRGPAHALPPDRVAARLRQESAEEDPHSARGECKLRFPDKILRQAVRRGTVRVECPTSTGVTLQVRSTEGARFDASVLDISTGGCSFLFPDDESPLSEGCTLALTFSWGEEREVLQHGTLFRVQNKRGRMVGHVGFHATRYEAIRELGELVTHIERVHIRTRHNQSPTETENLADLYRPTPSASTQEREARANRIRTV